MFKSTEIAFQYFVLLCETIILFCFIAAVYGFVLPFCIGSKNTLLCIFGICGGLISIPIIWMMIAYCVVDIKALKEMLKNR